MNDEFANGLGPALLAVARAITWASMGGIDVAWLCDVGTVDVELLGLSLSPQEQALAAQAGDASERRHFIFRRCFQRLFVARLAGVPHEASALLGIGALPLVHRRDQRPHCAAIADVTLSFSSSGPNLVACALRDANVGIDIERIRTVEHADGLARRFLTPGEAEAVERSTGESKSLMFLKTWSAKEAALKAIGQGIDSGLNNVVVDMDGKDWRLAIPASVAQWRLEFPDIVPGHIVALVHEAHQNDAVS